MTPQIVKVKQIINCYECIFFERMDNRRDLGFCHSQAPIIIPGIGNKTGMFPIVGQNSYCGDAVLIQELEGSQCKGV